MIESPRLCPTTDATVVGVQFSWTFFVVTRVNPPDYSLGFWLKRGQPKRELVGTRAEALAFAHRVQDHFQSLMRDVVRVEAYSNPDEFPPSEYINNGYRVTIETKRNGRDYRWSCGCVSGWAPSVRRALDASYSFHENTIVEAHVYFDGKPDLWVVTQLPQRRASR